MRERERERQEEDRRGESERALRIYVHNYMRMCFWAYGTYVGRHFQNPWQPCRVVITL